MSLSFLSTYPEKRKGKIPWAEILGKPVNTLWLNTTFNADTKYENKFYSMLIFLIVKEIVRDFEITGKKTEKRKHS